MSLYHYTRNNDIVEIKIIDWTGKNICKFKFNSNDKIRYAEIITYLKNKYNLDGNIPDIDKDTAKEKEDAEYINWLGFSDI